MDTPKSTVKSVQSQEEFENKFLALKHPKSYEEYLELQDYRANASSSVLTRYANLKGEKEIIDYKRREILWFLDVTRLTPEEQKNFSDPNYDGRYSHRYSISSQNRAELRELNIKLRDLKLNKKLSRLDELKKGFKRELRPAVDLRNTLVEFYTPLKRNVTVFGEYGAGWNSWWTRTTVKYHSDHSSAQR